MLRDENYNRKQQIITNTVWQSQSLADSTHRDKSWFFIFSSLSSRHNCARDFRRNGQRTEWCVKDDAVGRSFGSIFAISCTAVTNVMLETKPNTYYRMRRTVWILLIEMKRSSADADKPTRWSSVATNCPPHSTQSWTLSIYLESGQG